MSQDSSRHTVMVQRPHAHPASKPEHMQEALPFASKPKQQAAAKRQNLDQRRAVVREPGERKVAGLIGQLQALRNQRTQRRRAAQAVRNEVCGLHGPAGSLWLGLQMYGAGCARRGGAPEAPGSCGWLLVCRAGGAEHAEAPGYVSALVHVSPARFQRGTGSVEQLCLPATRSVAGWRTQAVQDAAFPARLLVAGARGLASLCKACACRRPFMYK